MPQQTTDWKKGSRNKTQREAERAHLAIMQAVEALQTDAAQTVSDWIDARIETGEGGKIKYTARNLSRVEGLSGILRRFQRRFEGTILGRIIGWVDRILDLNNDYFDSMIPVPENTRDVARRLALRRWGYNTITGQLIPGGYLDTIFKNTNIGAQIAAFVNRAIATNMSLAMFRRTFRKAFVGAGGVLYRYYKTNTFDLFQRIDRTAALVYADRLGLNYAVYSGTLEEDSRPFCVARVNKVYSRTEIKSWENLNFQGKPQFGYDPFVDCGGFNCRHHLAWVTDEIGEYLKGQ